MGIMLAIRPPDSSTRTAERKAEWSANARATSSELLAKTERLRAGERQPLNKQLRAPSGRQTTEAGQTSSAGDEAEALADDRALLDRAIDDVREEVPDAGGMTE